MSRRDSAGQERRLAWALTGSGHFFAECLEFMRRFEHFDLFVSRAATEVIRMYKAEVKGLPEGTRIFKEHDRVRGAGGAFLSGLLSHPGAGAGDVGHGGEMRRRHFRHPRHQRLCASRQVPHPVHRLRLRYRPGAREHGAGRHGQGVPAPHRFENVERLRRFEATEIVESMAELEASAMRRMQCAATPSS
jgi:dihydromethanopterin reductase (acceptor)